MNPDSTQPARDAARRNRSLVPLAIGAMGSALVTALLFGGLLEASAPPPDATGDTDPEDAVTYHGEVSRILAENCVGCHREGGIGPFGLETFEQAAAFRGMIASAVEGGTMPPWFASPAYGEWANDRRLAVSDREALLRWIEAGAPKGDPADAPPPPTFTEGWHIGEPDVVLEMLEPFEIPAEGTIPYEHVVIPTDFGEDRWIEAVEIRPTAQAHAHHVLALLAVPDPDNPVDPAVHGLQGAQTYFALMVPGSTGLRFGDGRAKHLPAGAEIVLQLHYTANGTPAVDRSRVGLIFAGGPPDQVVETTSAVNLFFEIPPGAKNHEVVAERVFREDGKVLSFMPHTHVRGVAFRYELVRADGSSEVLLDIPHYDFDWQLDYILAEPVEVEAGDVMRATAWYDNSADNPHNPDPTAAVRFGQQTWEEMMIGYFDWIPAGAAERYR